MNILVNQTTSSVNLPQNFFADSINSSMENSSNSTNKMRLSYTVFLTDILFRSQNESVDIGSIIVSTRLSNGASFIPKNPVEVSFRTVDMVIKTSTASCRNRFYTLLYMQINGTAVSNGACSYWDPNKGTCMYHTLSTLH